MTCDAHWRVLRVAWLQEVSDALETIANILGDKKPALVTGPAACGKSTFTKQYVHRLAVDFLETPSTSTSPTSGSESPLVPLLVTVIDLAETIKTLQDAQPDVGPEDDLLAEHIRHTLGARPQLVDLLIRARDERRMVVVLD